MRELEGKLVELVEAIEAGVVEYGPEALNMALALVRIESLGTILGGLIALFVSIVLLRFGLQNLRKARAEYDEFGHNADDTPMMLGLGSMLALLFSGSVAAFQLIDIWNWVGVIHPKLKLAYDIYTKVTGQ